MKITTNPVSRRYLKTMGRNTERMSKIFAVVLTTFPR